MTAAEKTRSRRSRSNGTAAEREYEAHAVADREDPRGDPDVLLDVPSLKVDSIHLEVDELEAHVALNAKVLDLVRLNAGVDVQLGNLRIEIKGVEAQALLKVRLDRVAAIVDRVLTTVDRNPELVVSLGRAAEAVGGGAREALEGTGEAVEDAGEGAGDAVGEVGEGAGEAAGELGEGAGEAAGAAGDALGGEAGGPAGASGSDLAKLAAKAVAGELKASAKQEARELGLAAARGAKRVGGRRRRRRAERLNATEGAVRAAGELDVDLEELEGSGAEGRVTIRDVRRRAREREH